MADKPHKGRQRGVNASWDTRFTESQIRDLYRSGATCSKVEAGRILGIHPDTVLKQANRGELPSFKRGHRRIFNVKELASLVGVVL